MSPDPCRCPHPDCGAGGCASACAATGILNIDKPEGYTSHDIVARVRRLTGERRVGHAGTLDPFATGVLLVCVGQATRVSEYLMEGRKLYRARIRFGTATDTYDLTGAPTIQNAPIPSGIAAIEAILPRFQGHIMQTPPSYSALKIEGVPAYRRARRGEEIDQAPRPVEIYDLQVRAWDPPDLVLDIVCGKGTYIRSLAHDLGQALGSAAHLIALERRAVGAFTIEDAVPLAAFEEQAREGRWQDLLYPLDEALLMYPALILSAEDVARLQNGQPVAGAEIAEGALARVYGPGGEFVALVQGDHKASVWRPHKVFSICA